MKLLVLGIGNILLTDDGVGVFAAEELQKQTWPESVHILEAGTFTHDIFYSFKDYTHILVLDIIHAQNAPGSMYRLTEDSLLKDEKQRLSIHDIDLIDSLRMAELYFKQQSQLLFLGIEPFDYTTWNIGLSPALTEVFPKYMELVHQEIQSWLAKHSF